jgi:DNA-binding response OmpR family regulator
MLCFEGYEVLTALGGEAGLRELEASRPDGILLALRMLGDNLAFLRRLRAVDEHRQTPVAVITGDNSAAGTFAGELRELEVEVYYKPVWLEDLVVIAERLLQRRAR